MARGNLRINTDPTITPGDYARLARMVDELDDVLCDVLDRVGDVEDVAGRVKAIDDAVFNVRGDMHTYDYTVTCARDEAASAREHATAASKRVARLQAELDDLSKRHAKLHDEHMRLLQRVDALEAVSIPGPVPYAPYPPNRAPWTVTYTVGDSNTE